MKIKQTRRVAGDVKYRAEWSETRKALKQAAWMHAPAATPGDQP